jgi:hypothetical protein
LRKQQEERIKRYNDIIKTNLKPKMDSVVDSDRVEDKQVTIILK